MFLFFWHEHQYQSQVKIYLRKPQEILQDPYQGQAYKQAAENELEISTALLFSKKRRLK